MMENRGTATNRNQEMKRKNATFDNNKPATFPYAAKRNTSWLRSLKFAIDGTGFTSLETLKAQRLSQILLV